MSGLSQSISYSKYSLNTLKISEESGLILSYTTVSQLIANQ